MALQFTSNVRLSKEGQTVNGKSIIEIATLGAEQGSQLEIEAQGTDARQAVDALVALVQREFDEEN